MANTIDKTAYTVSWRDRAGLWIGIGINPASITLGGGLASRLPLSTLIWLLPLSGSILTAVAITAGIIGRRRRNPLAAWSAGVFGLGIGAIIINLIMAVGMIGWNGFQLGLSGTSLANLTRLPEWVGVLLMAILFLILGRLGVNKTGWFAWLTTLASLSVAVVCVFVVQSFTADALIATPDPAPFTLILWAIGAVLSFAALFALRCVDFTWDMASDKDVVLDGVAFMVSFFAATSIGIALYRTTGNWDLAEILAGTRLAALGQFFLVISLIAPALATIHSGALAWAYVLPLTYRVGTGLLVAVGFLLGITRFDQKLLPMLDWIGTVTPPALAVMIAVAILPRPISQRVALVAWAAGAATAVFVKLSSYPAHLIIGVLASLVVVFVSSLIVPVENK